MAKRAKQEVRSQGFALIARLRAQLLESPESLTILDEKEGQLREAIAAAKVGELPEIRSVVEKGRAQVRSINLLLLSDEPLERHDRAALLRERAAHEFYLSRFSPDVAMKRIERLEEYLQAHLDRLGDA
jgi:hypothetical protein